MLLAKGRDGDLGADVAFRIHRESSLGPVRSYCENDRRKDLLSLGLSDEVRERLTEVVISRHR